jgi:hypothetical protein
MTVADTRDTMVVTNPGDALAVVHSIAKRGPQFLSLTKLYRALVERRRAQQQLFDMDYLQMKDMGFPSELDERAGRARWRIT